MIQVKRPLAAPLLAALLFAGLDASPTPMRFFAETRAAEAKIFHGVGTVTGVDPRSGVVTIDHKAIPGLMDAMEMDYRVKPHSLANGLAKGDSVEFDVDGKTLTIVGIKKVAKP